MIISQFLWARNEGAQRGQNGVGDPWGGQNGVGCPQVGKDGMGDLSLAMARN